MGGRVGAASGLRAEKEGRDSLKVDLGRATERRREALVHACVAVRTRYDRCWLSAGECNSAIMGLGEAVGNRDLDGLFLEIYVAGQAISILPTHVMATPVAPNAGRTANLAQSQAAEPCSDSGCVLSRPAHFPTLTPPTQQLQPPVAQHVQSYVGVIALYLISMHACRVLDHFGAGARSRAEPGSAGHKRSSKGQASTA
eukprot:2608739-Pleurochrysis_carterae.AAC.1